MIGILEELTFRGLVLNSYLKYNGITRRSVYKAVLFSSLIFGVGHYANLVYGGSFLTTSIDVYFACCMGVFLAAVYVKCMSVWASAFLHTLWNFGNFLGLYGDDGTTVVSEAVELSIGQMLSNAALNMIEPTIILLIGIFILRNIHKEKYMSDINKTINAEE